MSKKTKTTKVANPKEEPGKAAADKNPYLEDDPLDNTERYLPYLYEIRKRLFYTALIFVVASAIGFIFYETIIRFVLDFYSIEGVNIVFTSPFQFINLAIQSSFMVGLIVVFPLLIYQMVAFLRPALSHGEFKKTLLLIPLSLILFLTGLFYGLIIMKYTIGIFYEKSLQLEIGNILDVTSLLSLILLTAILLGVAFQFPLVMTTLIKSGYVSVDFFSKKRFLFYGSSIIFAAFLPPTDLFSLVLLFAPLMVLFEVTLQFNKFLMRNRVSVVNAN